MQSQFSIHTASCKTACTYVAFMVLVMRYYCFVDWLVHFQGMKYECWSSCFDTVSILYRYCIVLSLWPHYHQVRIRSVHKRGFFVQEAHDQSITHTTPSPGSRSVVGGSKVVSEWVSVFVSILRRGSGISTLTWRKRESLVPIRDIPTGRSELSTT